MFAIIPNDYRLLHVTLSMNNEFHFCPSVDLNTMFSQGNFEIVFNDKTSRKKHGKVKKLLDAAFNKKSLEMAVEYVTDGYSQHNHQVPTGNAGLIAALHLRT